MAKSLGCDTEKPGLGYTQEPANGYSRLPQSVLRTGGAHRPTPRTRNHRAPPWGLSLHWQSQQANSIKRKPQNSALKRSCMIFFLPDVHSRPTIEDIDAIAKNYRTIRPVMRQRSARQFKCNLHRTSMSTLHERFQIHAKSKLQLDWQVKRWSQSGWKATQYI